MNEPIETAKRPPNIDDADRRGIVIAWFSNGGTWLTTHIKDVQAHPKTYTHWFPMPKPPKNPSEAAFEKTVEAWNTEISAETIGYIREMALYFWDAALAWKEKNQ